MPPILEAGAVGFDARLAEFTGLLQVEPVQQKLPEAVRDGVLGVKCLRTFKRKRGKSSEWPARLEGFVDCEAAARASLAHLYLQRRKLVPIVRDDVEPDAIPLARRNVLPSNEVLHELVDCFGAIPNALGHQAASGAELLKGRIAEVFLNELRDVSRGTR